MNIFDAIGKTVFDIMRPTFGCAATWQRTNSPGITKTVLYKCPSEKVELSDNDYILENFQMEYYESDFPGLLDSASEGNSERIQIEVSSGVFLDFIVKSTPKRKGDGKTINAILTPVNL